MISFAQARENMVACQIHPNGVVSDAVLNAFRTVPRERFVPENRKGTCYADELVSLPNAGFLLEPALQARLIESLTLAPSSDVLSVGSPEGYVGALLRLIVPSGSVSEWNGDLLSPSATLGSFDAILFNGSVSEVPKAYFKLLESHGRLVCLLRSVQQKRVGQVVLYTKDGEDISSSVLFDAFAPYLPGLEAHPVFRFG